MSAQQQLLWEDLDLISSTTINGVLYGIALSLYVLAARSLYPQLKDLHQRRRAIFIFVYTSVVMICGIIFLALATRGAQLSYIDHNTFVGEPIEYQVTYLFSLPAGIAEDIFSTMIDILTLGIQIWRLWVIYSTTHYALAVIIFPLLLFLCFIAMDIVSMVPWIQGQFILTTSVVSQLAIEIFVTVLVIARLLAHHVNYNFTGASEMSKQYMSIAAMLIESYALESAWTLAIIVSDFLGNVPAYTFFGDCDGAIEVIAYLLVIYRVSTGRGWNKRTEQQISTLHFQAERSTRTSFEVTVRSSQALSDANIVAGSRLPVSSAV
ncbi:hypothetical protein P691DRAFT_764551 [Macrolepiota fuliginosa MF-IS2]|uniref:Uncharacterized protein n=1 Tax=Macrolepiota fuliginosa MF-IS2 TaxID=1400762 RepID=A0A9P6BYZ7_9AGAR|nr:hypothetical protein P691DRAFT_764551 [Macrolepiota fuliginosa MF-IS2]